MKLTVLVDNNTYIDRYYLGEPAVSYLLEDEGTKILFDTGYSDVYVKNADALGADLTQIDAVVLSHGHNDHTGGLASFPAIEKKVKLVAHPDVFLEKHAEGLSISPPMGLEEARNRFDLCLTAKPVKLSANLTFLGEIERTTSFENKDPVGEYACCGGWVPDYVMDDTALVYETDRGIYIITGCSHAGICNIAEYAKRVTGKDHILGIIGGLHLFEESEQLTRTIEYFRHEKIGCLYPCHCTSFRARSAIHQVMPVNEVGVGLTLAW